VLYLSIFQDNYINKVFVFSIMPNDYMQGGGPPLSDTYLFLQAYKQPFTDPLIASLGRSYLHGSDLIFTAPGQKSYFEGSIYKDMQKPTSPNPNPQSTFNGVSAKDSITIDAIVLRSTPIGQQPEIAAKGYQSMGFYN
jgi:hypothetical protein